VDEKDRAGTIVNITASLIKQRLDEFMRSTQGLPTDLRIEAMESVARHVMLSIKSMQYEAQRLKGEVEDYE
jgi:t-SNARE complex subunit (syntaxin)